MGQVSGNKIQSIMPSKNIGTKINTQVSGNKIDAKHEYNKITDVQKTQLDGQQKVTNYMGINDEGMDIMKAKKVTGDELNVITNPTIWEGKAKILKAADERIAQHEADVKTKANGVTSEEGPEASVITDVVASVTESLQEGNENVAAGAIVAILNNIGGVGEVVYTMHEDATNGADNAKFAIEENAIIVGTEALVAGTYKVSIEATDEADNTFVKNILIDVLEAAG